MSAGATTFLTLAGGGRGEKSGGEDCEIFYCRSSLHICPTVGRLPAQLGWRGASDARIVRAPRCISAVVLVDRPSASALASQICPVRHYRCDVARMSTLHLLTTNPSKPLPFDPVQCCDFEVWVPLGWTVLRGWLDGRMVFIDEPAQVCGEASLTAQQIPWARRCASPRAAFD